MFEFFENQLRVEVQEAEYLRLLGFPPGHVLDERPRQLADWARDWYAGHGRPWIFARGTDQVDVDTGTLHLAGTDFQSARLAAQFREAEAEQAILIGVSAGPECEEQARQCWLEGKPDEYFFLEMYGSAVVEYLVTRAAGRICSWADQIGLAVLPHYSPGYPGWLVSDQLKLWRLLRGKDDCGFPAELEALETGMLRPKKSLLGVFGVTRHVEKVPAGSHLVPCENCSLAGCSYRRGPYRSFMPQPETFGRRPETEVADVTGSAAMPALDPNARYSVNLRALKKWAQERLDLEVAADGSVKARFRYEGTTCSNLGRPIQFDYHVRLEPPGQSYRIAEAHCAPADGDTGHACMCKYLNDPVGFMQLITAERPLLDWPLNDALSWAPPFNPAGCYCEAASRDHKWRLVYQVIHFALAQNINRQQPGIPEDSPQRYG